MKPSKKVFAESSGARVNFLILYWEQNENTKTQIRRTTFLKSD